jgi:hypothetical protein
MTIPVPTSLKVPCIAPFTLGQCRANIRPNHPDAPHLSQKSDVQWQTKYHSPRHTPQCIALFMNAPITVVPPLIMVTKFTSGHA